MTINKREHPPRRVTFGSVNIWETAIACQKCTGNISTIHKRHAISGTVERCTCVLKCERIIIENGVGLHDTH